MTPSFINMQTKLTNNTHFFIFLWPRNDNKTSCTGFVLTSLLSVHIVFGTNTFLRCAADVYFAEKRPENVSLTSSMPILIKDVAVTKTYGSLGTARLGCQIDLRYWCKSSHWWWWTWGVLFLKKALAGQVYNPVWPLRWMVPWLLCGCHSHGSNGDWRIYVQEM